MGIFSHAFVLKEYFFRMWNLAHYQFFPLALLAAIWLFVDRNEEVVRSRSNPVSWIQSVLMSIVLALVVFATLLNSSFIGWISFVLFIATTIYCCVGNGALKALPGIVVLMLITPLPAELDQDLIIKMQYLASRMASWILDAVGVLHFRQGVVLVSETSQFLAEEACSGIRSLFSAIAAIVFFGLVERYSWWRNLLNVAQTVGWVLFGNAIRIAAVVRLEDAGFSVANGWRHEALGIVVFFLIVGFALSFDRLIQLAIPIDRDDAPVDRSSTSNTGPEESNAWDIQLAFKTAWIVALVMVGILSVRLMFGTTDVSFAQTFSSLDFPVQSDLPPKIGDWQVIDFEHVSRSRDDIQGQDSFIWSMKNEDLATRVSIDCQWNDFHDLSYCYTGLGWRVTTDHFYPRFVSEGPEQAGELNRYSQLALSKATGERGIVLFCGLDKNGNEVFPPIKLGQETAIHVKEKMVNSLRQVIGLAPVESIRNTTFAPPVTTVQVVLNPKRPIDDATMNDLKALFFVVREQIKRSDRFKKL